MEFEDSKRENANSTSEDEFELNQPMDPMLHDDGYDWLLKIIDHGHNNFS